MASTPGSEAMSLRLVRQARNVGLANREEAASLLRRAWEQCKQSEKVLVAVTGTLIEMGNDDRAHTILQEAILYQPESESLYRIIGEMALRMHIPSVAEKAFSRAFDFNPSEPSHIVNLAESLRLGEKPDAAINLLQSSLPHFPKHAGMWNALAQLTLRHLSDRENALIFQKEAVEQEPRNAAFLHNLALMYFAQPEARQYYELALKQAPKSAQIHLSYGLYLMGRGELKAAWQHYDYRLDPELGYTKAAQYTHGLPTWRGEGLKGKSILLCAEQGIGDEVLFGIFINRMIEDADKVYIGCDPRLVSLYNRSFPAATAAAFSDTRHYRYRRRSFPDLEQPAGTPAPKIDYAITVASLPRYLAPDIATFRSFRGGFAVADPQLKDAFAQRLANSGRPKIAVSWRSGNLKLGRQRNYLSVAAIAELATTTDADFYVLQYTYTDEEAAELASIPNIHFFRDIDLKQDIEANIALLTQMDASVGPPTATQMFAMAAGCPVMLVNRGLPWTMFGSTQMEATFATGSKYFDFRDEKEMVPILKAHIEQLR
jgi:tetratricopeptide (TPR) repeat protein